MKTISIIVAACLLGGCGITPGMQEGETSQPQGNLPDIQADIYPISPATIGRLNDEESQATKSRAPSSEVAPAVAARYQYLIGPADVLRVTVWDHPELNNPGAITGAAASALEPLSATSASILGNTATDSTARVVSDEGTMFFPYVGVVEVAGKSTEQVRSYLTRVLSKTIRDPQVEVVVATFRSRRSYITGEVKSPGVLPVSDVALRVADAVGAAGGLNLDADLNSATITHDGVTRSVDLYALLYKGDMSQNLLVQSGDLIYVPEQRFNKVFILGEVTKPGSLLLPRGRYTLNEALADSGGVSQFTAKASQIYVIRGTPDRPQVYHLDARKPDALILGDAFNLRSRDIIFVDAAEIVRFNRVISQVLPSLQALQAGKYLGQ